MNMVTTSNPLARNVEYCQNRLNGLQQYGALLQQTYKGQKFDRKETILALLGRLKAFATQHFQFFAEGFTADGAPDAYQLERSNEYPPDGVLVVLVDQAGADLAVIEQAASQRMGGNKPITDFLRKTDQLAWEALRPAIGAGLVPSDSTVLTYLHKSPNVRIMPYAPVALVGLPQSSLREPRDLLSIPHEVGHYVYQLRWKTDACNTPVNSRYVSAEELAQIEGPDDDVNPLWWQSEVFADVYGGLIAGPVIAYSSQQLERDCETKKFFSGEEYGVHPTPNLRPDIYTHILRKSPQGASAAALLEKRWNAIVADKRADYLRAVGATPPNDEHNGMKLGKLVESAYGILQPLTREVNPFGWSGSLAEVAEPESFVQELFEGFVQFQESLNESKLSELADANGRVWEQWIKERRFFFGNVAPKGDAVEAGDLSSKAKRPRSHWIQIWHADGWGSEQDGDDPPGG